MPPQHKPAHVPHSRVETTQDFLKNSKIPSLHTEDINSLEDDPINNTELQEAIKELKTGKSPGPAGFTSQYYKTYTQLLSKRLLKAFNHLAKHDNESNSLLMAHIAVIPKQDKDHTDCKLQTNITLECRHQIIKNLSQ